MADGMQIRIGADVSDATRKLQSLEGGVAILEKQLERLQKIASLPNLSFKQIERLNAMMASTQGQINKFNKSAESINPQMAKVAKSTAQANTVIMNTGRIFQDLPFGIIGVANNINPLVESFGALSRSAKETGVSIGKQLMGALTGAGGLAFGFSIVTAALSFLTIGFSAFTRGLSGSKKGVDENKAALDALAKSIEATKDSTEALINTLQFLNQLGGINVKIRGGGTLSDLIEQSVAQQQQVVDLQAKSLEAQQTYLAAFKENQEQGTEESIAVEKQALAALRAAQGKEEDARREQTLIYRRINLQKIEDAKDAAEKLKQLRDKEIKDLIDFAKNIEKAGVFAIPLKFQFSDFDSAADELQKALNIVGGVRKFTIPIKRADITIKDGDLPTIAGGQSAGLIDFNDLTNIAPKPTDQSPIGGLPTQSQMEEYAKLLKDISFFGDNAQRSFNKIDFTNFSEGLKQSKELLNSLNFAFFNVQSVAIGFGEAVGSAFNAILEKKNAFVAFFESLGNAVKQLITRLISAVAQAAVLSLIFPGAGQFSKFFFGGLGIARAAEGGIVPQGFGGDRYPALLSSGEAILNNRQIAGLISQAQNTGGGGILTGRLRGEDLLLQSERTRRAGLRR